jgi:hypothetical protein
MSDVDERHLLDGYRDRVVPDDVTRQRLLERLLRARRLERSAAPRTAVAIALACLIAALVLLVMHSVVLVLDPTRTQKEEAFDAIPPRAHAPARAHAPVAEPTELPIAPRQEAVSPRSTAEVVPQVRRPTRPDPIPLAPPAEASIALEAAVLREAQAQLRAGDHAGARAKLDEHRTRFPDGQMRDERDAITMLVACAEDASEENRARARKLLAGPHVATYAARIRSTCGV